jgi:quercetin dioxygenase-like cupin family protein
MEYHVIETTPELQTADTPEPAKFSSTRVLMSGTDTEGRFALIQMVVRREHEPPCHLHTREDEVVYVVEGTVVVSIDGVGTEYTAGEAVLLPRGQAHGYLVRTDEARLLVLAVPAGIEGFYTDLEAAQLDVRYVERLIALAARHGVEITGPPIRETSSPSDILPEGGVLTV